jgi:hypothetical protein
MKKEYRSAIRQGITESKLNGYKWTITPNGLKWSYCDVEFTFKLTEVDEEGKFLTVREKGCNEMFVGIIIDGSRFADANTIEEAYRKATKATIAKANHLY